MIGDQLLFTIIDQSSVGLIAACFGNLIVKKTLHPQFRGTFGNVLLSVQLFSSNSYKKRVQLADSPAIRIGPPGHLHTKSVDGPGVIQ